MALKKPSSPNPTRSDSTAIVEAVVEAALLLGPGATIDALCRRAGVGRASFYRHFKTKASVFAEVNRKNHRDLAAHVRQAMVAAPSLEAAIDGFSLLAFELPFADGSEAPGYAVRALPFEWYASVANESTREIVRTVRDGLARWMDEDEAHREAVAYTLLSLLRGVFRAQHHLPELAPDPELLQPILRSMMMAAVRGETSNP